MVIDCFYKSINGLDRYGLYSLFTAKILTTSAKLICPLATNVDKISRSKLDGKHGTSIVRHR